MQRYALYASIQLEASPGSTCSTCRLDEPAAVDPISAQLPGIRQAHNVWSLITYTSTCSAERILALSGCLSRFGVSPT